LFSNFSFSIAQEVIGGQIHKKNTISGFDASAQNLQWACLTLLEKWFFFTSAITQFSQAPQKCNHLQK
jgi:hypothetical protein